jgi:hypothetical protein
MLAAVCPQQSPSGQHTPSGQHDALTVVQHDVFAFLVEATQHGPAGQHGPSGQHDAWVVVLSPA